MASQYAVEKGTTIVVVFRETACPAMWFPPPPPLDAKASNQQRIEASMAASPRWNSHVMQFQSVEEDRAGQKTHLVANWERGNQLVEARVRLEDILIWGPLKEKPEKRVKVATPGDIAQVSKAKN